MHHVNFGQILKEKVDFIGFAFFSIDGHLG